MVRGRAKKISGNVQKIRSKSKGNVVVTFYQFGRKDHKKPDCRYYKVELKRKKNIGDKRKRIVRMKHITTLRTRTKRRPKQPLVSSLKNH